MNRGVKNTKAADRICELILSLRSDEEYIYLGRMIYKMGYKKCMKDINGDVSVDLKKISADDLEKIKNDLIKYIESN